MLLFLCECDSWQLKTRQQKFINNVTSVWKRKAYSRKKQLDMFSLKSNEQKNFWEEYELHEGEGGRDVHIHDWMCGEG